MSIDFKRIEDCAHRADQIERFIQRLTEDQVFSIDTAAGGDPLLFGPSLTGGDGSQLKDQIIKHLEGRLSLELMNIRQETSRTNN